VVDLKGEKEMKKQNYRVKSLNACDYMRIRRKERGCCDREPQLVKGWLDRVEESSGLMSITAMRGVGTARSCN
jgi:hypothetical protein